MQNPILTFAPHDIVGLATRRSGPAVHLRATIGTGIVTLPLAVAITRPRR